MSRQLSAGSTIETRCTRCKGVLNHTIVAMVGEKIVRVECSTCHGLHAYHPPKPVKEAKAAKSAGTKTAAPRKTKADPDAAARAEWEALQPGLDSSCQRAKIAHALHFVIRQFNPEVMLEPRKHLQCL